MSWNLLHFLPIATALVVLLSDKRLAAGKSSENETKPGQQNTQFNVLNQLLITAGLVAAIAAVSGMGRPDVQEISFQHFKTHLLAKEGIDKLEVTNKTLVKVYLRQGLARCALRWPLPQPAVTLYSHVCVG